MSSINIQDFFLEQAKAKNYVVTVYLVGKVRLMGTIKDYDRFSVTITSYGQDQLIYKQAISTIQLPRGRRTSFIFAKEDGKTVVKKMEPKPRSRPRPPFQRNPESSSGGEQGEVKGHSHEQRRSFQPSKQDSSQPSDSRGSQPPEQHSPRPFRPYDRRDDSSRK